MTKSMEEMQVDMVSDKQLLSRVQQQTYGGNTNSCIMYNTTTIYYCCSMPCARVAVRGGLGTRLK